MPVKSSKSSPPEPLRAETFHEQGTQVLQRLRSALADLISHLGMDSSEPQEISRQLSIDKNLAWRLSRFVREHDAWSSVPQLPGTAGFNIFLAAAKKSGAKPAPLESLRAAVEQLDDFVRLHADDRETFAIMAGSISPRTIREQSEAHRRLAYRGQSAVWGVQVRVNFGAHILIPSNTPGMVDIAVISGFVDFRRLRPDVAWTVATISGYAGDADTGDVGPITPLDPVAPKSEQFVLAEFCSSPHPLIRMSDVKGAIPKIEITEGPSGNTGTVTCVTGWIYKNAGSIFRSPQDRFGEHIMVLSTPAELAVLDLYVHDSLSQILPPQLAVYSNLPAGQTFSPAAREKGLLPIGEELLPLGAKPPSTVVPEAPFYTRMIRQTMERLGYTDTDFHGYRMRLKYPPVPSLAIIRYPLLERGN